MSKMSTNIFQNWRATIWAHEDTMARCLISTKVSAQQTTDDATEQPSTDEVTIKVHDTNETLFSDQT